MPAADIDAGGGSKAARNHFRNASRGRKVRNGMLGSLCFQRGLKASALNCSVDLHKIKARSGNKASRTGVGPRPANNLRNHRKAGGDSWFLNDYSAIGLGDGGGEYAIERLPGRSGRSIKPSVYLDDQIEAWQTDEGPLNVGEFERRKKTVKAGDRRLIAAEPVWFAKPAYGVLMNAALPTMDRIAADKSSRGCVGEKAERRRLQEQRFDGPWNFSIGRSCISKAESARCRRHWGGRESRGGKPKRHLGHQSSGESLGILEKQVALPEAGLKVFV